MDPKSWPVLFAIAGGLALVGGVAMIVRAREPAALRPYVPGNEQVTPAPTIDGVTLRTWLIHHHPTRDQVWPGVVAEFYRRAAADPVIADYFRAVDMETQQRHFCRALSLVTGSGLTVGALRRLRQIHARVLASDGTPITGQVYDTVASTLLAVLADYGVPASGRNALAVTIAPLRAEIARV